jgi:uncharacterized membrane protein
MSEKKQKSVTVSPENAEYLSQQDNASALIDDLVSQYRKNGTGRGEAALDLQINQKEGEVEEAREKVARLERELAELKQLKAEFTEQENAELQEAREILEGTPRDPQNPAVKTQADRLGMTTTELLNEL